MDWIIFGDDWGAHPSTTQHLILNLPSEDKVIWVDSIGMRQPTLKFVDLQRIVSKVSSMFKSSNTAEDRLYSGSLSTFCRIKPKVIPWHLNSLVIKFNSLYLSSAIRKIIKKQSMHDIVILSSTPVAVQYANKIPHDKLIYLRLDVYDKYPGCDPLLVQQTENRLYDEANAVVATAKSLMPNGVEKQKLHYLPQGVQFEHFTKVTLKPNKNKILGFFGTLSEWVDYDLIEKVAIKSPDWTLEFIGKVEYLPEKIRKINNIKIIPQVAFSDLPNLLDNWTAAWIPFQITTLTLGVNPLKIREYLACGLASHCTPLPEVQALEKYVKISDDADEIVLWMNDVNKNDTEEKKSERRQAVEIDSWANRALQLRKIINSAG